MARMLLSALCAGLIGVATLPVQTTSADAFFFSIFRGRSEPPPLPYRDDRRGGRDLLDDFFGDAERPRSSRETPRNGEPFAHLCVRTCDGKFFPVNRGGRNNLSLDKICNAMCPAAQTKIFSGHGIDSAVSADGQRYTAMPNAFAYRTKIVDNCSCTGRDPYGVVNVDLDNDTTLQSGDVVVRENGLAVYRGNDKYSPVARSGLNPSLVKQLQSMRVLPNNPHASPASTVTTAQGPEAPRREQNASQERAGPNANAAPAIQPATARAN